VLVLLVFLSIVAVPGAQSAGVATGADDTYQATAGGNFTVAVDSTNSPVVEGERLNVSVTVENTNREADTQEVALTVGGIQRDSSEVTLEGGESTAVSLTWNTGSGDAGNYTASVATANDTVRPDVTVHSASNVSVTIEETNAPVTEGEDLNTTVTVENIGDRDAHNVEINYTVGGVEHDSTNVTLEPGESTRVTLTWETGAGDSGDYEVSVSIGDDTDTTAVLVHEPAQFGVTIEETNAPVTEGEDLSATVTVENVGDLPGNKTVTLSVGAVERDSTDVRLDAGESREITLVWETSAGDAGDYTANITVGDSGVTTAPGAQTSVEVREQAANEPPNVSIGESRNKTVQNETTVTAEASDPDGNITTYTWEVDGEIVSRSRTLEYTFAESGEYEVTLTVTDEDGASTTATEIVTVVGENDPPTASVEIVPSPPAVGESVTITVEASDSDGDIAGYRLDVDGDGTYERGSNETEHTFEEAGEHEVIVRVTDDDGGTTTVERSVTVEPAEDDGFGGLLPIVLGLVGAGVLLAGGGYYFRTPGGGPESSSDNGVHTQHDEFDSEDKMQEDSGDGDGRMDPADSAFPPFTDVDAEGADGSDDGDDENYNETETIIDPEPGGASDSGGDGDDPPGTDSESGAEETSRDGDNQDG
jgi:PKD repeat protein